MYSGQFRQKYTVLYSLSREGLKLKGEWNDEAADSLQVFRADGAV